MEGKRFQRRRAHAMSVTYFHSIKSFPDIMKIIWPSKNISVTFFVDNFSTNWYQFINWSEFCFNLMLFPDIARIHTGESQLAY